MGNYRLEAYKHKTVLCRTHAIYFANNTGDGAFL